MTPWGADPAPSGIVRTLPVAGSRWPSVPSCWPVYQTPPSGAGATSCGCEPATTSNSRTLSETVADRRASRTTVSRRSARSMASQPASRRRSRRSMAQPSTIRPHRRRAPSTGSTGRGGSGSDGRATRTDDAPRAEISRGLAKACCREPGARLGCGDAANHEEASAERIRVRTQLCGFPADQPR